MLGKINENLDPIQKTEIRSYVEKIRKALFLPIAKDDGLPSIGLSQRERQENNEAVSALNEISKFLGI